MHYYIQADGFFLKSGFVKGGYLEIVDGKFGAYQATKPAGKISDYTGKWIAPGLFDTHIHGFLDHDVMDNDFEGVKAISKGLLSCGVTNFLPTTLTADAKTLAAVSAEIGARYQEVTGAKIEGIFFEGPFFTAEHKGAQNPNYFGDPNVETFNHWQEVSGGLIKKIAIAPERAGATEFIQDVTAQGVAVALGHSAATYDQALAAVNAGANIFVHTYNGMSPLNHREPGMVGAAMSTETTIAELICDGHHVHPAAANVMLKAKTPANVALITDCMRAGGMPDGDYVLGEFPVIVKDGAAHLKDGGSLAGSVLKLIDGVKNVVDWGLATPAEAIKMASYVPAVSVGLENKCGSIQATHAADFIVLDTALNLCETYLDGNSVYKK